MSQKQNKGQNLHHQTLPKASHKALFWQSSAIQKTCRENREYGEGKELGYGEVLEVAFLSCLFSVHSKM